MSTLLEAGDDGTAARYLGRAGSILGPAEDLPDKRALLQDLRSRRMQDTGDPTG